MPSFYFLLHQRGGTMQVMDTNPIRSRDFFFDLTIYLAVMFGVREVYFSGLGFMANGLFWSLTTLIVSSWRMKVRGVTWRDLGFRKPESLMKTLAATGGILAMAIGGIILFQMIKEPLFPELAADVSGEQASSKFGDLKGNWWLFFSLVPIFWLESLLEELLDRGFLMNWLEKMFTSTRLATILAVVLQAMIFGFRHSNDLSERSITVGLIGLAMGIGYVAFGRNLWPLILAHCLLNTMSMIDRV
jgi:membrane protease YdiL (CAAX protease family)